MSAANASAPAPSIQDEMRAHEPSMEEILASIRRIIADDEAFPAARRDKDESSIRDEGASLSEELVSPVHAAYPAPALDPAPEPVPEARPQPAKATIAAIRQFRPAPRVFEPQAREPEHPAEPEPATEAPVTEAPISAAPVSEETDFALAVDALYVEDAGASDLLDEPIEAPAFVESAPLVSADAATSVASHFKALAASMVINDSGLLQKYAQEMLRPLLKQWLDDNLPLIVERLVRAEIERVARGGRR